MFKLTCFMATFVRSLVVLLLCLSSLSTAATKSYSFKPTPGYKTFSLTTKANVTRVFISNPPINVLDGNMLNDFNKLLTSIQNKPNTSSKAYVFSSADPIFFISHLDVHSLSYANPPAPPFTAAEVINTYNNVTNLLSTVPAIIIGEVSGEATAAGNELLVQMDMRYATTGAKLSAAETGVGLLHAAGGLQHLVRLIGPGRAAEYLLSATSADAQRMADIGWVNRAFDSRDAMETFVNQLTARIGVFPRGGLVATKKGIRDGFGPRPGSVRNDIAAFNGLLTGVEVQKLVDGWLTVGRDQTRSSYEKGLPETLSELYPSVHD